MKQKKLSREYGEGNKRNLKIREEKTISLYKRVEEKRFEGTDLPENNQNLANTVKKTGAEPLKNG